MKNTFLIISLIICFSIKAETDSLPWITFNFKTGLPIFFSLNTEGIPNSSVSQPISQNRSYMIDLGFRLNRKNQLFFGGQALGRTYNIKTNNTGYGLISKNHSTSIVSIAFTYSRLIYRKNDFRCFLIPRVWLSHIAETIQYVYNDSIPPNNYTLRERMGGADETRTISPSLGFGIEHKLFIKELYLMFQTEYVLSLYGHHTSRLCLNAGLSFKVY